MACDLSGYKDFLISLDASKSDQVDNGINIKASINGPVANTLVIFTGIAILNRESDNDDNLVRRGTLRVKLNFPLSSSLQFVSAASNAGLASIFNRDDDDTTYAIDCVSTQPENTDPQNPQQSELVLSAAVAIQGGQNDAGINRMAYQANVLLLDTEPDLESILVRAAGSGLPFTSLATIPDGDTWEYLLTLTGPAPGGPNDKFTITLQTSDHQHAPIDIGHLINEISGGQVSAGSGVISPVSDPNLFPIDVTITATGRMVSKTATLRVLPLTR
jgi:hypothetical protein